MCVNVQWKAGFSATITTIFLPISNHYHYDNKGISERFRESIANPLQIGHESSAIDLQWIHEYSYINKFASDMHWIRECVRFLSIFILFSMKSCSIRKDSQLHWLG